MDAGVCIPVTDKFLSCCTLLLSGVPVLDNTVLWLSALIFFYWCCVVHIWMYLRWVTL